MPFDNDPDDPSACELCDLVFHVVANNDASIAAGDTFVNFCPRCGEEL